MQRWGINEVQFYRILKGENGVGRGMGRMDGGRGEKKREKKKKKENSL